MSETPPEPQNPPADPPAGDPPPADPPAEVTWESLAEKGIRDPGEVLALLERADNDRKHSRTWEDRAKAHQKELDKLKREGLPADEKARAEQEDRIRAEERSKLAPTLGRAAFATAAAGKVASVQDALDLIDPSRFVREDGTVDDAKVQEAVAKFAKLGGKSESSGSGGNAPAVERGPRNGAKPTQLTKADLERMSPDEINKARREKRLDDVLGITR